MTVGTVTNATTGVEAGVEATVGTVGDNAANPAIHPTLAHIARSSRGARRKPHPNTPEDCCFWNKKYKGYRGKWIYDETEMAYVPRHNFATDMGGYPSESDDE